MRIAPGPKQLHPNPRTSAPSVITAGQLYHAWDGDGIGAAEWPVRPSAGHTHIKRPGEGASLPGLKVLGRLGRPEVRAQSANHRGMRLTGKLFRLISSILSIVSSSSNFLGSEVIDSGALEQVGELLAGI